MFCARLFICALWSPAGKGLTSWLSFVVSTVSLSLSHWYPGSGVVLDCIDCRSLHPYLLLLLNLLYLLDFTFIGMYIRSRSCVVYNYICFLFLSYCPLIVFLCLFLCVIKIIFLISQPKHMLWELKRIASLRRLF